MNPRRLRCSLLMLRPSFSVVAPWSKGESRRGVRLEDQPASVSQPASSVLPARFHIDGEIGRGGMAVVYRAQDKHLGRFVAIKVLEPGSSQALDVERFQREIAVMAKLVHPG